MVTTSALALLYQCKNGTKEINQAVKNNHLKFPERFSWILTKEEIDYCLRSKFSTLNNKNNIRDQHYKYLPRVFTEQGIAMLSTILKSKIAIEVSIRIMDTFVAMRHYIGNNEYRISNMETKIIEHDNNIKLLQETLTKFEEKKKINTIFYNGQIYDAYSLLIDILNKSKNEIIIIDNYAGKELLDILRNIDKKIIIIY